MNVLRQLLEPPLTSLPVSSVLQWCLSAAHPTSSGSWWFSFGGRIFLTSSSSSSTSTCSETVSTPNTGSRGRVGTRTTPSPRRPSRYSCCTDPTSVIGVKISPENQVDPRHEALFIFRSFLLTMRKKIASYFDQSKIKLLPFHSLIAVSERESWMTEWKDLRLNLLQLQCDAVFLLSNLSWHDRRPLNVPAFLSLLK